jgi:diguanylate cyclase (GGDEF)-like protein/PAS domain S-box-containing protein
MNPPLAWLGTLKARLLLLSVPLLVACVFGVATTVLHRVERRAEAGVMDLQAQQADRLAGALAGRVLTMQRLMRAAAETLHQGATGDEQIAREALLVHTALGALFDTTFIADASGRVLAVRADGAATTPELHVGAREYFQRTVSQGVPVVSPLVQGRVSKGPVVVFTMPVFDGSRRVAGVLGGTMRLAGRNLLDDLTFRSADGGTHTVVTDAHGVIVSHPDRERVGTLLEQDPPLRAAALHWAEQGRPLEPTPLVTHEGDAFLTLVGVPAADWMLFSSVPQGQLLGDMALARREAMALAAGVALGGALLLLGALALLLGPLKALRGRALRLNDPGLPATEGWPDVRGEIGDLSRVLRRVRVEGEALERQRQQMLQQLRSVLASAPIGIAFTRERCFELVSAEFCALLGWDESGLNGRPARDIFASDKEYDELGPHVAAAFATGRPFSAEMQFRRRDGRIVWCQLQGRPVDAADASAGTIWLLEDVTERRAERERLSWSASHDMLTRLLNRAAFEQRLADWMQAAEPQPAALLLIDLDRFKQVNDGAGHAAGDDVLRQAAAVLQGQVRGADAAARLGGDEFALLLPRCEAAAAQALAGRVVAAIGQLGVNHGTQWLGVGASVGIASLVAGADADPAAALARADAALYEAKRAGRGRAVLARQAGHLQLVG